MIKSKWLQIFSFLVLSAVLFSCAKVESLVSSKTEREKYLNSLEKAGLETHEPVQMWMKNFEQALQEPIMIEIPYSEQIIYPVGETRADAFLINIPAGREVEVEVQRTEGRGKMFMEAREFMDRDEVINSADSSTLKIDSDRNKRQVIIIIQPELMSYGKWNFSLSHHPSIAFPVEGKNDADIGSIFGDPRDGGSRKHHGIDIFAAKGTPILAVEDGWIYRTGQNNLGGNVVWLNSNAGSIYYAHLDSIAVSSPKKVNVGDTLGFVGNTGNAKHTPPHLHFGIYNNGPLDPYPFVSKSMIAEKIINYEIENSKLKLSSKSNFRIAPSTKSMVLTQLEKDTEVFALGKNGEWLRVWTEIGIGYIHSSLIELAEQNELKVEFHP